MNLRLLTHQRPPTQLRHQGEGSEIYRPSCPASNQGRFQGIRTKEGHILSRCESNRLPRNNFSAGVFPDEERVGGQERR